VDDDRAVDDPTPEDCERGLAKAREIAGKIVRGEGDPLKLADGIYWAGYLNGGFAYRDGEPVCPQLNEIAGEMVQLTAWPHVAPDRVEAEREAAAEIREVAAAFLKGHASGRDNG